MRSSTEASLRECLIVFVAVVAGYILLRDSALFLIGAFNDDGAYVMLGKSLAIGRGYHLNYLVADPVAVKYPPGLPALLAIPWALGGTLGAVRATVSILNPVVCGLAAALIWWIGRRQLMLSAGPLALAVGAAFFLDPVIQYYNIPLSEPYFLLGWAAAVALAGTVERPAAAIGLGVVLAVTALFRSAGLVLIPACLAALVLRLVAWRNIGASAIAAFIPLILWATVHARIVAKGPLSSSPDEVSYWTWIQFGPAQLPGYAVRALWNNGIAYFTTLSGLFSGSAIVGNLLVAGVLIAAAIGTVRSWRRAPAVALTTIASLGAVLIWPFAQDRLLLPVIPFVGLLAAAGLEWGVMRVPPRARVAAPLALVIAALTIGLRQVQLRHAAAASFVSGQPPAERDASIGFVLAMNSRHIAALSEWLRINTTPQDRLLVDFPAATYLYSGRVTAPASPTESDYAPSVFRHPGQYLANRILQDSIGMVAIGIRGKLVQDIETISSICPGVLQRVVPSAEIYRVSRDDACLRIVARQ